MTRVTLAALLGCAAIGVVGACASGQQTAEAQLAAIVAGCKVALDLEHDGGEAGAADETGLGCRAAIHSWERAK